MPSASSSGTRNATAVLFSPRSGRLLITMPFVGMVVPLVSTTNSHHYDWGLSDPSTTSPNVPTRRIPAQESYSSTEPGCYVRFDDGIIARKSDSPQRCCDGNRVPPGTREFRYDLVAYPCGWLSRIGSSYWIGSHHPHYANPHTRGHVGQNCMAYPNGESGLFKSLDEYTNMVHSNAIGRGSKVPQSKLRTPASTRHTILSKVSSQPPARDGPYASGTDFGSSFSTEIGSIGGRFHQHHKRSSCE